MLPILLTDKKCIIYILFLKTFLSSRVLEYSVYSAFKNIQYFPCFRMFRIFRIFEYSVCSAIPFRHSVPRFHDSTIRPHRVTLLAAISKYTPGKFGCWKLNLVSVVK